MTSIVAACIDLFGTNTVGGHWHPHEFQFPNKIFPQDVINELSLAAGLLMFNHLCLMFCPIQGLVGQRRSWSRAIQGLMIRGTGISAQSQLNTRTGGINAVITGSTLCVNRPRRKSSYSWLEPKHADLRSAGCHPFKIYSMRTIQKAIQLKWSRSMLSGELW